MSYAILLLIMLVKNSCKLKWNWTILFRIYKMDKIGEW